MFFVAFLMIPKCLFNTTLVESANFIENFLDVQCIKFSSVHYRLFVYFLPKTASALFSAHFTKKILNLHNVSHAGPKALTQIHSHSVAAALSLSLFYAHFLAPKLCKCIGITFCLLRFSLSQFHSIARVRSRELQRRSLFCGCCPLAQNGSLAQCALSCARERFAERLLNALMILYLFNASLSRALS